MSQELLLDVGVELRPFVDIIGIGKSIEVPIYGGIVVEEVTGLIGGALTMEKFSKKRGGIQIS